MAAGVSGRACRWAVPAVFMAVEPGRLAAMARRIQLALPPDLNDPLKDELTRMPHEDLVDLVVALVARDPANERLVALHAAERDDGQLGKQLTEAVRAVLPGSSFMDYRRAIAVARDVQEVLDEIEQVLDSGQADAAAPALKTAVTRVRTLTLRADDSSGALGDACQRAADLYATACRQGHSDPVRLARWLLKFRAESPGWPNLRLEQFVAALDDKGLAVYRAGVQEASAKQAGQDHWSRFEIDLMLLELADHDGDVETAVTLLRQREHPEYGAIVDRLRAADRPAEAIAVLDEAIAAGRVSIEGNQFWVGAQDAAATYLDIGRPEDALAVLRSIFRANPSRRTYAVLVWGAERAGTAEQERRAAWDYAAERAKRTGSGALLVDLALEEGDVERAWALADEHGPGPSWPALAAAVEDARPDRAADLYEADLATVLGPADRRSYKQAARQLQRIRDLRRSAGQAEAFNELLSQVREQHRRRPAFLTILDRAGLK